MLNVIMTLLFDMISVRLCAQDDLFHAVKAIVACQRDYGRRDDRKQARLKYLVSEWGIDKFRAVVEQYFGQQFESFRPLPAWEFYDYLGWHEQNSTLSFFGCYIQNGRLKGDMKKTLRKVHHLPRFAGAGF